MDFSNRDKTNVSIDPKENMLEKYVQIVTSDGRIFVGIFLIYPAKKIENSLNF